MTYRVITLCLALSILITPFSFASDFHSARTAALGGAGRAAPLLNDAIFLNPSFAPFLPSYSLHLSFLKYRGGDQHFGRNYTVSVQDGRSKLFQAGAAYTVTEPGAWLHVGASRSLVARTGIGLGGKFFISNQGGSKNFQDLLFSTAFLPEKWLQLAFTIDNVIQSTEAKELNRYREFAIGAKFNIMTIVFAYVDPHYTPSFPGEKLGYEVGLEFPIFGDAFLRMGTFKNALTPSHNQRSSKGYSAGLGWVGGRLSLDYALKRDLEPGGGIPATTVHVFGATAFF